MNTADDFLELLEQKSQSLKKPRHATTDEGERSSGKKTRGRPRLPFKIDASKVVAKIEETRIGRYARLWERFIKIGKGGSRGREYTLLLDLIMWLNENMSEVIEDD